MKVGDLVLDLELNEMGIITEIILDPSVDDKACAVVTLADGQSVLATQEELKLIVSGDLI